MTGLAAAVLGMWKLTSRIDRDAAGQRHIDPALGENPLGVLSFAPGYFAAQFMKRDRSAAAPGPAASNPAPGSNNSVAVNGYDAYFGTYTLDESSGALVTRLEGSISQGNIGASFKRDLRVDGNELRIQLATTAADGTAVTRTLTFSRVV